jgi:hypothetical protein
VRITSLCSPSGVALPSRAWVIIHRWATDNARPRPTRQARPLKHATPAAHDRPGKPRKAALGDKPAFAYISSLPQPQRSIAERVDALAAETLPGLQRSVQVGHGVVRRRRRLVLRVRRLRRPRQADVRSEARR